MSEGMLDCLGVEGGESEKMSERLLLVAIWMGEEGEGGVEGGVTAMGASRESCMWDVEVDFKLELAGVLEDLH